MRFVQQNTMVMPSIIITLILTCIFSIFGCWDLFIYVNNTQYTIYACDDMCV